MNPKLLSQLKALYREGFPEDNETAVEWFFSRMKDENIAYRIENGKIISAGYIIEKPAMLFGKKTILPFLTALATRKEYRGQGKIKLILDELFSRLRGRGHNFCALYPFNHEYYKRFGFCDVSFCADKTIGGGEVFKETLYSEPTEKLLSELVRLETAFRKGFDNYLIFGKEEITAKFREFALDGVPLRAYSDESGIFAYCFAHNNKIYHYATSDVDKFSKCEQLKGHTYYDFRRTVRPFVQGYILHPSAEIIKSQKNLFVEKY